MFFHFVKYFWLYLLLYYYFILSYHVTPCLVLSYHAMACPVLFIMFCFILLCLVLFYLSIPRQLGRDQDRTTFLAAQKKIRKNKDTLVSNKTIKLGCMYTKMLVYFWSQESSRSVSVKVVHYLINLSYYSYNIFLCW